MDGPSQDTTRHYLLIGTSLAIIICGISFLLISPGTGYLTGTCGPDDVPMTCISDIRPEFATSFPAEFGGSEPDPGRYLPLLQHYPLRREAIDKLMARQQVTAPEDSILGLYEFPDSRIVLIDRNSSITEIIETGEDVRTYTLIPEPVGIRRTGPDTSGPQMYGNYTSVDENTIAVDRVDVILPGPKKSTAPLYIVRKTMRTQYSYEDGSPFATIGVTGTFYVKYGQGVELVVRNTSVILDDPRWKLCSQGGNISLGDGMKGELKDTLSIARGSERMRFTHLITTSAHTQIHDCIMGSMDHWKSRDVIGCSC